jgi:hypothetical protein
VIEVARGHGERADERARVRGELRVRSFDPFEPAGFVEGELLHGSLLSVM